MLSNYLIVIVITILSCTFTGFSFHSKSYNNFWLIKKSIFVSFTDSNYIEIENTNRLSNKVEILYCTKCRWLLRSAWIAQELLTTFENNLNEVSLQPISKEAGTFIIKVNNNIIWDRKSEETKGFPEIKQIKQLVRDIIDPQKDLGHSDKSKIISL